MSLSNGFKNLAEEILSLFKTNNIYALVGESGTGKSYRARFVAAQYKINTIIDDGLLIYRGRILAGKSAKNESTYMGAVRVALFDEKVHRDEVAKEIRKKSIRKILILGTSERMVIKIAVRLQLPLPDKIISITEIATPEDIEKARQSRMIEGKHVIPVEAEDIAKNYSSIFSSQVRFAWGRKNPISGAMMDEQVFEKSIVEPTFSRTKRKEISHALLASLFMRSVSRFKESMLIRRLKIERTERGYVFIVTMSISQGRSLTRRIYRFKKILKERVEGESSVLIEAIHITLERMLIKSKKDA